MWSEALSTRTSLITVAESVLRCLFYSASWLLPVVYGYWRRWAMVLTGLWHDSGVHPQ